MTLTDIQKEAEALNREAQSIGNVVDKLKKRFANEPNNAQREAERRRAEEIKRVADLTAKVQADMGPRYSPEKVERFIEEADERDIMIHIETSGTIEFFRSDLIWMSVSPKHGVFETMIIEADEIKLLVDEHFDLAKIPPMIVEHPMVFVQPINDELMVSRANFERCMEILRIKPEWHLSIQQHKLLGLR